MNIMNTNNENEEELSKKPVFTAISEALLKLKKEPQKEGVDLVGIAKKLSEKKFGKEKRK